MKNFLTLYPEIQIVNDRLKARGFQFFLVGGCVRDFLLGEEPKDIDVVTDALPDTVEEIFKDFRILPIGKAFGIIKILFKSGFEMEVATFRQDIGKGRRPDSVVFTTAEEDVKRRDFTINGLLYDIDTDEIVDFVGGKSDLDNKILRTIGSAEDRFDEDPLRKLRALRFAHRLGFSLDGELNDALFADPSLEGVSHERIVDELTKAFRKAQNPTNLALDLHTMKFDKEIFGATFNLTGEMSHNIGISLAKLFFRESPKAIHNMLKTRKFPSHVCDRVEFMLLLKNVTGANIVATKKRQKALQISSEFLERFLNTFHRVMRTEAETIFLNTLRVFIDFQLQIDAQSVMEMGFTGPQITSKIIELEASRFKIALFA